MTTYPPPPFLGTGVGGGAPGGGVTGHLPRSAGEEGRGCRNSHRACAGGPAEAP